MPHAHGLADKSTKIFYSVEAAVAEVKAKKHGKLHNFINPSESLNVRYSVDQRAAIW